MCCIRTLVVSTGTYKLLVLGFKPMLQLITLTLKSEEIPGRRTGDCIATNFVLDR